VSCRGLLSGSAGQFQGRRRWRSRGEWIRGIPRLIRAGGELSFRLDGCGGEVAEWNEKNTKQICPLVVLGLGFFVCRHRKNAGAGNVDSLAGGESPQGSCGGVVRRMVLKPQKAGDNNKIWGSEQSRSRVSELLKLAARA